ncbi:MAG: DUF4148 domain-containing protein [Paraburkholderia tropica]|jgi:hypothetical protein|uniref:Uncharacterized protein DUF4148 n=1 Tax=Paraburkholderia tropica TaxID=92647 RepID=A0ABX5MEI5_9BURK|nr:MULTISPECIES: DUF4148 domain-containing protein [Paraburkholderia]MBB3005168.1 hypothetical protein [Paraburkholderia tropica]MBB6320700.1 hypothetical protein [Paraburkholderia tropica]MDE1138470.1 DUF4148 domain-containing protein [Paraburkholderia tropica]PXX04236.1 uncharacterized protein DUF4148 [Paraburkholderia tropica]PZW70318.1 uncharacterized protein DUF4148 [Paraburkholderia tropica]
MRRLSRILVALLATFCSLSAFAAPRLTPQQCADYPFKPVAAGKVTHKQLMRELGELEARGYDPGSDDGVYPSDLQAAEKQLHVDYRSECRPVSGT